MHSGCAFPRRDGEAVPQSSRRSRTGSLYGESQSVFVPALMAKMDGQEYDLRNTASIEESVRHSDIVYNLVGRSYPTK